MCLDTGWVIHCGAGCGWADPIRDGRVGMRGGGEGGGAVGSAAAQAAGSQDNLRPLHPGGMCL